MAVAFKVELPSQYMYSRSDDVEPYLEDEDHMQVVLKEIVYMMTKIAEDAIKDNLMIMTTGEDGKPKYTLAYPNR